MFRVNVTKKYGMYRSRKRGHLIKSNKAQKALWTILLRTNCIFYRVYIKNDTLILIYTSVRNYGNHIT